LSSERRKKLVLYVAEGCIPCARILKFLERSGASRTYAIEVVDARERKEELLWITGGRPTVPVLLDPETGRVMVGCPVEFEEFLIEFEKTFGLQ